MQAVVKMIFWKPIPVFLTISCFDKGYILQNIWMAIKDKIWAGMNTHINFKRHRRRNLQFLQLNIWRGVLDINSF